jgi:hypothetical protein
MVSPDWLTIIVVSSRFTLNLWKVLAKRNVKLENFRWMNAFNMVGLFMEALLLDCLVEHIKMDLTLRVTTKFSSFASLFINTLVSNSSIARR